MQGHLHPRVTIVMKEDYKLLIKEDVLDGLRSTEFDPEKVPQFNFLFKRRELTHLSQLKKSALDLELLADYYIK